METTTQVFENVDTQELKAVADDTCRRLERALRKDKDRRNLMAFGTIGFEKYLQEVCCDDSVSLQNNLKWAI